MSTISTGTCLLFRRFCTFTKRASSGDRSTCRWELRWKSKFSSLIFRKLIFNRSRGLCGRSHFLWTVGSDSSAAWGWESKQTGSVLHGRKEDALCSQQRGYLEHLRKTGNQRPRKWKTMKLWTSKLKIRNNCLSSEHNDRFRRWSILKAKAINVLSIFFILLSTISFCLETIPHFQENNCYTGEDNNSLYQLKDYHPARFIPPLFFL